MSCIPERTGEDLKTSKIDRNLRIKMKKYYESFKKSRWFPFAKRSVKYSQFYSIREVI